MRLKTIKLALATGAIMVGVATPVASSFAEEAMANITPARPLTSKEETATAESTEKLLKYLAEARKAMDANDMSAAHIQLIEARSMLNRVRNQRPPASVSYKLSVQKESGIGQQDIDRSLATGETPKLSKAVDAIRNGNKDEAVKNLDEVGAGIAFVSVGYIVDDTDAQVTKAIRSLEEGKTEDASKSLRQARQSMSIDSGALAVKTPSKKKK